MCRESGTHGSEGAGRSDASCLPDGAYGGQVRNGERSTLVIYYGTAHKREAPDSDGQDGDEPGTYRILKSYAVVNSDQIDNLPDQFTPKEEL